MSADLFAEFGSAPSSNRQQQNAGAGPSKAQPAPSFSFFDDLTTPAPASAPQTQQYQPPPGGFQTGNYGRNEAPVVEDNDDWGDFEGGASSFEPVPPVKQDQFAFSAPQASQPTWSSTPIQDDPFAFAKAPPAPPAQPAWTTTESQNDPFGFGAQPNPPTQATWQQAPVIKAKKSADPSVLFDAEDDFGDDDDFGDFEDSESKPTATTAPTNVGGAADLLGDLSLSPQPTPVVASEKGRGSTKPKAPTSHSKKGSTSGFGSVSREKQSNAFSSSSTIKQEDSWDTFDDWEATIPTTAPAKASKPKEPVPVNASGVTSPPPILSPTVDDPRPGELPPTNVPPPTVLLSLFPPLFTEAQNKLFKPMAAQTLPMRNKLLSEPATISYLQGYLMLASVVAQIIAGRKLRWKRDQHLSQGMRIGPASSRATSGMKLSSIDKSENMKEEREVSDVVRAWKDQVGRLRHVISAANQIKAGTFGVVPDIQETMPVKLLKQVEGGVPAPQPCMLCGLKRDERVGGLDLGVEDSFGEWWVDQVNMHRGCRNFWNEHRDKLRQR